LEIAIGALTGHRQVAPWYSSIVGGMRVTESMIKRVAVALREAELTFRDNEPWINHVVRNEIEAMRDPTEAMLDAYWH
jgi:hypothetical protein